MRLKDLFEAPPVRFNPDGTVAGPGQSARPGGPVFIGLPARPGQEVSGPITQGQPTRPDQSTSGAPTGVRAPGTTTSNLRRGSSGSDVSGLQQMLIDKGYDLGDTGADGKFGPRTAAAVKQFQTDFGLQVDGIAGDQTMSALNRAQGGARPTVGAQGSMPAASPATGGRGDGNAELQRRRGYQDGLDAARPPASSNVPPTRFNPNGTVAGPGQAARPGGTINPNPLPGTPRFNPSGTVAGPGQAARPGGTINPNPLPGTPRFNPSGTVAGPGQAARPGGTSRPLTPPSNTTRR
jgi:peptidoglycan hydrolase-like protein with peptidoglycan-binding domain